MSGVTEFEEPNSFQVLIWTTTDTNGWRLLEVLCKLTVMKNRYLYCPCPPCAMVCREMLLIQ